LADVAEKYLRKGSKVYIEGRIRTREYTDKEGVKKYFTDIQCDNFLMLDRPDSGNTDNNYQQQAKQAQQAQTPADKAPVTEENPEDDLPF
jgi:single-strand DNA-binding protein